MTISPIRSNYRNIFVAATIACRLVLFGNSALPAETYPEKTWQARTPEEVGLDRVKLDELAQLVGGRGCVVRHGYLVYQWGDVSKSGDVASAVKPVISTLAAGGDARRQTQQRG